MSRVWLALSALALLATLAIACGHPPPTPTPTPAATPTEDPPTPTATPEPTATPLPSVTPTLPPPTPIPTPSPTPTRAVPAGRPVAVVVENDPRARPQTGLGDADVLYEAVAEWNLTRFVAVLLDRSAEVVGPVRSSRAYHAAIAAEYEAAFAHCLDVPPVAGVLAASKVVNLDGCHTKDPPGFFRDWSRDAPHNLYVSVPELRRLAGGQGTYGGLGKRQAWPPAGERVEQISFVYPEEHPVVWRYDPDRREYLRWQDDEPHLDVAGRQVSASSVVVQFVAIRHSSYWGEAGYHELTVTGRGDAILYAEGQKRAAIWRRGSYADPTRYFDARGEEIPLPPGQVFVQLVGQGTPIEELPSRGGNPP